MDVVEFQEKMDPTHRMYLCRMLDMKELPEDLLVQYLRAKKMVDRIDGFLSAGTLALIAMIAGIEFEGESAKQAEKEVVEKKAAPMEAPAMTGVEAEAAVASGAAKLVESPVLEKLVEGSTGQSQGQPIEQPAGTGKIWSPGMPVNVLQDDELRRGCVVGILPPAEGSEKPVQLTIEFADGKTETFDEDEAEAV